MPNPHKGSMLEEVVKIFFVLVITALVATVAVLYNFSYPQIISATVFTLIITATTFFWEFHLPISFVGIALLMIFNVMDLPKLIVESKLDIILFLVGMMVVVGILKELGLFSWIIISVISRPMLTARRFVVTFCVLGVIVSCVVDEMTAIVFTAALIFQVCDTLNIKAVPFIIMAVMSTNIGSAGTMLGNPVGIIIGQGAVPKLSFNDFMVWSFPVMMVEFTVVMIFMLWNFRKEIREMDARLTDRRENGLRLGPLVEVPHKLGLFVLVLFISLLSLHTVFEGWLGLTRNTVLIVTPLLVSGILMLWRRDNVRNYIEHEVEWVTLIFFMMLFVVAGTLEHTRVTERVANGIAYHFADEPGLLLPVILGVSALGSAFIENIVFVAAFMPVVVKLEQTPLLWALLHGACLGGNITMIGSTANIAAVSMLEKRYWTRVDFFTWAKTGAMVGVLSCVVAWICFSITAPHMPTKEERLAIEARSPAVLRALERERAQKEMGGSTKEAVAP